MRWFEDSIYLFNKFANEVLALSRTMPHQLFLLDNSSSGTKRESLHTTCDFC